MPLPRAGAGECARRRSNFLSLRRKKVTKEKATPLSASPALRYGATCGARVQRGLARTRFAQTIASPDPLAAALLGAYRGDGEPNIQTATRAIAALGPVLWAQAPCTGRSLYRVERSEDPNGCLDVHPLLAAPAAGRLRGGTRVGARVLRELTRCGCPNGAATQRSEFRSAPRSRTAAGLPRSAAKGSQTGGRLFFAYFLLAKQKKVRRPPGRTPGSRPPHRQAARSANQSRNTSDHSAHYQFNSYQRIPHKRQIPIQSKPKPHPTPATPHSPAPAAATAAGTLPPAPAAPHGTAQPPTCPASPLAPGAWAPSCARH